MTFKIPAFVPENLGEYLDLLGASVISPSSFKDVDFPDHNLDSHFYQVDHGLANIRNDLTGEQYGALADMARRARELFAADPEDKLPEAIAARDLLLDMIEILEEVERQQLATGRQQPG